MNNTDFEFSLAMLQVYVFLGYLYYVVGKNGSKMAKMAKNTPNNPLFLQKFYGKPYRCKDN